MLQRTHAVIRDILPPRLRARISAYRERRRRERPEKLAELLTAADLIAADLQCFYRLDFYLARRGPVFGEFTSYPFGGKGFTPFGGRLMCDLMDRYPDAV